jgi:replicative DNA helicase
LAGLLPQRALGLRESAFTLDYARILWRYCAQTARGNGSVGLDLLPDWLSKSGNAVAAAEVVAVARKWATMARMDASQLDYHVDQVMALVAIETYERLSAELRAALQGTQSDERLQQMASSLDAHTRALSRMAGFLRGETRGDLPAEEVVRAALESLERWQAGEGTPVLRLSKFPQLDTTLGGIAPNDMVSFIGDAKSGKTTFLTALMLQLAEQGRGLVVPTELDGQSFVLRALADLAGVSYRVIRSNTLTAEQKELVQIYSQTIMRLSKNVVTLLGVDQTPDNVVRKVQDMLQERGGCAWVIVDSGSVLAQRRAVRSGNEVSAYAYVASRLQEISATYSVPVFVTWQIGRKAVGRATSKRVDPMELVPRFTDAMWSSTVEQNSSLVLGVMRFSAYVEQKIVEAAPEIFPDNAITVHLLVDRYGGRDFKMGAYFAYRFAQHGGLYELPAIGEVVDVQI